MKNIILHLLLVFSLVNQSIDFDYAIGPAGNISTEYDDIDSIWEFLLEKITGNDQLLSENDDDSGGPVNDVNKDGFGFQYYHEINSVIPLNIFKNIKQTAAMPGNASTCKGHQFIVVPPPDSLC